MDFESCCEAMCCVVCVGFLVLTGWSVSVARPPLVAKVHFYDY